jgi:hypothetical protein
MQISSRVASATPMSCCVSRSKAVDCYCSFIRNNGSCHYSFDHHLKSSLSAQAAEYLWLVLTVGSPILVVTDILQLVQHDSEDARSSVWSEIWVGDHVTPIVTNLTGFFVYRMVIVIPFSIATYVMKQFI